MGSQFQSLYTQVGDIKDFSKQNKTLDEYESFCLVSFKTFCKKKYFI